MADIAASSTTSTARLPVIVSSRGSSARLEAQHVLDGLQGAVVKDPLPIIGGYTAEIDSKDLHALVRALPAGVEVTVDERQQWLEPQPSASAPPSPGADDAERARRNVVVPTLRVDEVWQQGFRGQGVGVAVIDTGIYPHADLAGRIVAFHDVVNGRTGPYDDQGHGTHVAGDLAGNGTASEGRFMGTAPEANLIGIKVLDSHGSGSLSDVIKGLQWAVDNKDRYDIRVVNMSLGAPASGTSHSDLLCEAVEKVVEAGLVTVVAAGNSGPGRHSVTTPGIDPKVITVGALDDAGTIQRTDDSIAEFSGRGPTKVDRFVKPDLVTPGVKLVATSAPGSTLDGDPSVPHVDGGYIALSGTSMATPVTSGIVACLLSARPNMTPLQLKHVLKSSAEQLDHVPPYTRNDQGAGVVDAAAALALARAHEGAGH